MTAYPCCSTCQADDCGERMCTDDGDTCAHGYLICLRCCLVLHEGEVAA